MNPEYYAVVTIKSDTLRVVTTSEMAAARMLTGGTTYNAIPQPTEELAIREAEASAYDFRRRGYKYEKNWKRHLKKAVQK